MDYFSLHFLAYTARWITSALVMFIPLYFLVTINCCKGPYQEYIHLLLVQIIGAFIFYRIDAYIFTQ